MRSRNLACPNDKSETLLDEDCGGEVFVELGVIKDGAEIEADSIAGSFTFVARVVVLKDGCGRASEAVDERCGTACEDDTTAIAGLVEVGTITGIVFNPPFGATSSGLGPGDGGVDREVSIGVVFPEGL
jgi:hypothetical protein